MSAGLRLFCVAFLLVTMPGCGYFSLARLDKETSQSWGELQEKYRQRGEAIQALLVTVKGHAKKDQDVLEKVSQAREAAAGASLDPTKLRDKDSFQKFELAQAQLSVSLNRMMQMAEKYPELKADEKFRQLQTRLADAENEVSTARKRYVELTGEFNLGVKKFPSSLTARYILGLSTKENFAGAISGADKSP